MLNINNKILPLPIWCYISNSSSTVYICETLTNSIWFWQNFTATMHHLLAINIPNFSWICLRKQ